MSSTRGLSLTKAIDESRHILGRLLDSSRRQSTPISQPLLDRALREAQLLLVEEQGKRRVASAEQLEEFSDLWTVDSEFYRSADRLLSELPVHASVAGLLGALSPGSADGRHADLVLCGLGGGVLGHLGVEGREISEIHLDAQQRRIDFRWRTESTPRRWISCYVRPDERQELYLRRGIHRMTQTVRCARSGVAVVGGGAFSGVKSRGTSYLFPDTDVARLITSVADAIAAA